MGLLSIGWPLTVTFESEEIHLQIKKLTDKSSSVHQPSGFWVLDAGGVGITDWFVVPMWEDERSGSQQLN